MGMKKTQDPEQNAETQDPEQNAETQDPEQHTAIQQEPKENCDISEVRNMIYEGNDYIVSVSFNSEAELPDDVVLMVREILPESTEYATYYEQTKLLMPEDQGLVFCRFFDVSFEVDEVEVEPKSTVDVQISYNKPIAQDENTTCSVVHFAEDGTELLSAEIQTNENGGDTIAFSQDSFSVVGTAITALNLSEGSYIFYKDEYAIGANFYGLKEIEIAIDENGYVRPKSSDANIDMITWTYKNGALQNKSTGQYLYLEQNNATGLKPLMLASSTMQCAFRRLCLQDGMVLQLIILDLALMRVIHPKKCLLMVIIFWLQRLKQLMIS